MSQKQIFINSYNVRNDLKTSTLEEIKTSRTTKPFSVATFNLKGDLNLGVIMRTAELVGARDFFILGHRQWDRRSAVGTQHYINVEKHEECVDWATTRDFLYTRNYVPVVVEHGGYDIDRYIKAVTVDGNREWYKPCFIFGPEDEGFPSDWQASVSIKQLGVSRSYNVSAAASIVLYKWSFDK